MSDIDRPLPLAPLRFAARGCARPRRAPATASQPCAAPAHVGRGDEVVPWTGTWIDDAPVFFSSYPAAVNSRLVREAGFAIERDELVAFREPAGEATFQWILARS